jgi:4-amino-4-deoxy-L-arabinose transferase-like glycosyltransferase
VGVIPAFLLAKLLRLGWSAYPATLLYALHPALLVNGRRAMMEGSLTFLTLLTVCWLTQIIKSGQSEGRVRFPQYAILGILIGLTVAAKHTGIVVAAAVLVAVLLAGLIRERTIRPLLNVGIAGLFGAVIWLACNPGYWRDPVGTFQAVVAARTELLERQSTGNPTAYTSFGQRVGALLTQPFLTPTQFYEAPTWAGLIDDQIAAYRASGLAGLEWGRLPGIILTILAGAGLLALLSDVLKRDPVAWALLLWLGATGLSLMAVPLDWQRYYLPWLLPVIILTALGLSRVTSLLARRIP